MENKFYIGFNLRDHLAEKICTRLNFACEIANGSFTFEREGACTAFIAPRKLGKVNERIVRALLEGFRLGALN